MLKYPLPALVLLACATLLPAMACAHAGAAPPADTVALAAVQVRELGILAVGFIAGLMIVRARRSRAARHAVAAAALAVPLSSFTQVTVPPVPNSFVDGQPAVAAEVNENFAAVTGELEGHANDTDLHPTSVDQLEGGTITSAVSVVGDLGATGDVEAGAGLIGQSLFLDNGGTAEEVLSIASGGFLDLRLPGGGAALQISPSRVFIGFGA